jgi:hypothetical protein
MSRPIFSGLALLALAACAQDSAPASSQSPAPETGFQTADRPPDAAEGTCWSKASEPAVLETVTEQIEVEPPLLAVDGTVRRGAVFRTETRQIILRERQERFFETPCPEVQTAEFIATLQRALAARGLFAGAADGEMTQATRAAIRAYQSPEGLNSDILSMQSARALGLVAIPKGDG